MDSKKCQNGGILKIRNKKSSNEKFTYEMH
jgi:hypothetical protein